MKTQKKKNNAQPNSEKKMGLSKKQRGRIYTGAFLVLVLIFFIVNNSTSEPAHGPYPPHYKSEVTKNTKLLKLSDYRGKVVVIDFWATWCPPCRKGIPDLISLKKKYKNKDFEIIGISLDKISKGGKTVKDVVPFIKEHGINYPIVWGDMNIIQKFGGVRAIPTTFFIDKNGKIRDKIEGLSDIRTLEAKIDNLLSEKQLTTSPEGKIDFKLPLVEVTN